jgi:SAM-dependent methyltransferase
MEHKDCGGKVTEKWHGEASEQFSCLKCGKVWGVVSNLSDIRLYYHRKGKLERSYFSFNMENFSMVSSVPPPLLNWLFNDRLRHVIKMVDFPPNTSCIGLDVGCTYGYLAQYLAERLNGSIIGVDVDLNDLYRAKIRAHLRALNEKSSSSGTVEFIRCSASYLPFKRDAFDLVTCVSVLEHIGDLEGTINEIKASMRENSCLIAGYPIETTLFKVLLKLFLPSGLAFRDPTILGKEKFESSPETHKQSFMTIRRVLKTHFSIAQRRKSFFTILPDQISWYECTKMNKK